MGMINFPVRRHIAGSVQYAMRGSDVNGYTMVFIYASLCSHFRRPAPKPYHKGQCLLRKISTDPRAHRRTWWSRSERLIGADPLNAGLRGIQ